MPTFPPAAPDAPGVVVALSFVVPHATNARASAATAAAGPIFIFRLDSTYFRGVMTARRPPRPKIAGQDVGRNRSPCMPPSTASEVPVVAEASGLAR
ncbi:hypothetical protein Misp01_13410 [Microtetraspora sp. NBRC 13810]|nr:hypothetical protein Misp01_13410 [Microtetraspora sp. NBRC 13810]